MTYNQIASLLVLIPVALVAIQLFRGKYDRHS